MKLLAGPGQTCSGGARDVLIAFEHHSVQLAGWGSCFVTSSVVASTSVKVGSCVLLLVV